jgi:putative peptide maturation system protein
MSVELAEAASIVTRDMRDVRGSEWTPEKLRQAKVGAWRRAFPALAFHITWEREEATKEYHFDVIVTSADEESVVVSYCPPRGIPFVARGAQRVGEHQLLRIDGEPMTTQEALAEIELGHQPGVLRDLASRLLLRQEIDRIDPSIVAPTEDELKDAAEAFRLRHGLFETQATLQWLDARGMTWKMLLARLSRDIMVAKLRDHEVGGDVDVYFRAHKAELDRIIVEEIALEPWADADAYAKRARDGEAFMALGQKAIGAGDARRVTSRSVRAFEVGAALDANAGSILVRAGEEGLTVVSRVALRIDAVLDDATRTDVSERLFALWIDERMNSAHVEWQWGMIPARAEDALEAATPIDPH